MKKMKKIYLDNAAATPTDDKVVKAMLPFFTRGYANPSSIHKEGKIVKIALEKARKNISIILNCKPEEIIFTSGATESVNLAIRGIHGNVITSNIEHAAVIQSCLQKKMEKNGEVIFIKANTEGIINSQDIEKALGKFRKKTNLISIMYANNEIGSIQPIKSIAKVAKKHKIPFHTDACQAGSLELDTKKLGVSLMTLNGGKIYGPKGVGILFCSVKLKPLFHGGGQEFGLRSGTENVPAIIGFAKALELVQKIRKKENKRLAKLRDYFIKQLLFIHGTKLNGHPTKRLPNNVNVTFDNVDSEHLAQYLSYEKIFASTGSACSANKIQVSHVLKAIGLTDDEVLGSIRFSLGRFTTKKDINHVLKKVKEVVNSLRQLH
jgi:cysteine desulfurase